MPLFLIISSKCFSNWFGLYREAKLIVTNFIWCPTYKKKLIFLVKKIILQIILRFVGYSHYRNRYFHLRNKSWWFSEKPEVKSKPFWKYQSQSNSWIALNNIENVEPKFVKFWCPKIDDIILGRFAVVPLDRI